ncbi:MAG: precorrin-8X methylmutase [Lachnospiraceae bacterium]|nr:precorrin-8X methylmutase [Lachnospiraceae bacterium]
MNRIENIPPMEIEHRSFEIIEEELTVPLPPKYAPIIKRVIHTTADFSYADNLCFSEQALEDALRALKNGAHIVTDTTMAMAGINKRSLSNLGGEVHCFIRDEDVAREAKELNCTRSAVCMKKAAVLAKELDKPLIFAIGNAPTALVQLKKMIEEGTISPALIIGVPVGFVNVVEAKEMIMETQVPYIVARGRKGGSNVAAAICNALLYQVTSR